jgi:iron complex transport system substrate-binding protein
MPARRILAAALPLALLALAGCASTPSPAAGTATSPAIVDNCGTEVALGDAPERIITIKSTTTELVAALGLGERIFGAAFLDGPLPDGSPEVPVLSESVPSQEAVLALEPDLVLGGWESNFSADGAGERDELAALGVASYVAPSACLEPGYQPDPLTFDALFDEIAEAGALLGAEDAAAALVEEQRAALAAIEPVDGAPTALWWSSGDDTPYIGAGIGAPAMMLEAAGLSNIAGDLDMTWSPLGWEPILAADPDVIVLVDASWNTAASKIERLESDPALAELTAVREQRYATVPFAAGEAGVRNVEAVASIVEQLRGLGL